MDLKQMLFGLALIWAQASVAQHTLFFETIGSVSSTQSLNAHVTSGGFDSEVLSFSSGSATNPVDIRSSSNSSGSYVTCDSAAASGGANVWFSSSGERGFSIHGIRAAAFDSLQFYFAYRKESASGNAQFHLDYSTNQGQSWDSITGIQLPADSLSTGWYYLGPIQLPSAAQVNHLALRWVKTQGSMRIDDISLIGNLKSAFIQQENSLLSFRGAVDYLASPWQQLQINLVGFESGDSLLVRALSPFSISKDTAEAADSLYLTVDSSDEIQSIWARLNSGYTRGFYSDSIYFIFQGHSRLAVPISGNLYHAGEEAVAWNCESASFSSSQTGFVMSNPSQENNHGSTQFLSSSSSSDNYGSASGNQNAALAVHTGALDTATSSYIAWRVFPSEGKEILFNGISFGMRATSTGPQSWTLRSERDSFQSDIYTGEIENDATWHWVSKDSFSLRFNDSLAFRLYFYDGSGSASTNIANFRLDDLSLLLTVWNTPEHATYRSRKSGELLDSSLWSYAYYDTLYQNTSRLPDSTQQIIIRASDSCWLESPQSWTTILLLGKLHLSGHDLSIYGSLIGDGKLLGHSASTLRFRGNDSSVLRFEKESVLKALRIEGSSPQIYLQDSLLITHVLFPGAGTLFSNGLLHLGSASGKTAWIDPEAKGTIEGALCMQTMIPGNNAGWRGFMSPLDTVTLGQLGNQIELHLQNTSNSGDNRNCYQWKENTASWNAVSLSTFSLHDSAVNVYLFSADSSTIELCGLYDTSSQNFGSLSFTSSTSQAEGWHFTGNPYPSALRWSGVSQPNGINGNYALWSVQDGNYRTWNGSIGSAGDLIPPFQGFWVKVNQSLNQDFILHNTNRDTGDINHFGKKPNQASFIGVRIKNPQNGFQDAVFYVIEDDSSTSPAPKLFGKQDAPQIWMNTYTQDSLCIAYQEETNYQPIHLSIPTSGSYTFQINFDGLGSCPWEFYDEQTQSTYAIGEKTTLSVQLESGFYPNRFELRKKTTALPKTGTKAIPNILVQKPYLIIQNPAQSAVLIYAMDGRLLQSFNHEQTFTGKVGPTQLPSGIYLVETRYAEASHRQLIYIP